MLCYIQYKSYLRHFILDQVECFLHQCSPCFIFEFGSDVLSDEVKKVVDLKKIPDTLTVCHLSGSDMIVEGLYDPVNPDTVWDSGIIVGH